MSKRDCASGAEGKKVAEKKYKLPWPPGDSGKEFSYTFTGEEQIGHTIEVMRTVKGREVKAVCVQGERRHEVTLRFIMCSGLRLHLPQPFSHHYPFPLHCMEFPGRPTWKMMNEEGVVFSDECSIFVRQVQTKTKTQISLRSMWDSRGSAAAPEWRGSGWLLHAVGDKRCRFQGCHKGFS